MEVVTAGSTTDGAIRHRHSSAVAGVILQYAQQRDYLGRCPLFLNRCTLAGPGRARAGETPPPALPPLVQMACLFGAPCLLVFAIDEDIPES